MAEKVDSDRSISEESSSSSSDSSGGSSSGSTEGDDETVERVQILGHTFDLPQEICEDFALFKEIFSMKTFESLEDKQKDHLMSLMPKFTENPIEETEKTLKMLFDYEPLRFTSPLSDFHNDLKLGNYRPEFAQMRKLLEKTKRKQQRRRMREHYAKLLPSMLLSRERLLAAVKGAPPGQIEFLPKLPPNPSLGPGLKSVCQRAKQRYFDELNAVRSEVGGDSSDVDENYPEGPDEPFRDRQLASPDLDPDDEPTIFGTLSGSSESFAEPLLDFKEMMMAHKLRRMKREVHPELNTNGITLEDIEQRVCFGGKKTMFGGIKYHSHFHKLKRPKKEPISRGKVSEGKSIKRIKEENDDDSKHALTKIKYENESDSESSFVDTMSSPHMSALGQVQIKQEVLDDETDSYTCTSMDHYGPPDTVIKEEPLDGNGQGAGKVHIPIKLEDLDGIDMMALPIQLADETGEVIQVDASADALQEEHVVEVDESLTETTHASFLSLVRALFPARDAHRASRRQLHARCGAVMKSPIAPLNTWYPLSDDWCAELDSALEFLAGERGSHPDDFVPYLQYMSKTQMYQWIGAGRDCDSILDRLCDRWLRSMSPRLGYKNIPPPNMLNPICREEMLPAENTYELEKSIDAIMKAKPKRRYQKVLRLRYPTSWTVRPPTAADVSEFRVQERRRFSSASKPFTYIQHGYRSVVGPCARAWVSSGCAGTALLAGDRPRHATFTSLVRDALARLPNGEGTRHDTCTLLKMSQYIAQCSEQALLGAVSSVLERFHTAKRDPLVKHDPRTDVWTYLHRNRTEEDWLKSTAGRSRGAKQSAAVSDSPPVLPPPRSPPPPRRPPPAVKPPSTPKLGPARPVKPYITSPPPLVKTNAIARNMEVESRGVDEVIEASDSDVDVDDSGASPPAPHLSSAQLLMQAAHAHAPPPLHRQRKHAPAHKRTYTLKQTTFKQSKQAALMSQSVKQAKILAEAVKQASATAQNKANLAAARSVAKQAALLARPPAPHAALAPAIEKASPKAIKTVKPSTQSPKAAQSPKQPSPAAKQMPTSPMQPPPSPKQISSPKPPPSPQRASPRPQSPLQPPLLSPKQSLTRQMQSANKPAASAKQPPLPGKQLEAHKSAPPSPKQPISEKHFPPVYLTKEEVSLSGKGSPQTKQSAQMEIKSPQTIFLPPQSPVQPPPAPKSMPQASMLPPQSPSTVRPPHSSMPPPQSQSAMQPPQTTKLQTAKIITHSGKQLPPGKKPAVIIKHSESSKPAILTKSIVSPIKTIAPHQTSVPTSSQASAALCRPPGAAPTTPVAPHKPPLIKHRTSIKADAVQASVVKANILSPQMSTTQTTIHPNANPPGAHTAKLTPGTRSLLIKPANLQTSVTASLTPTTQATGTRRSVVRVLSPANPTSGKSLISPRALLQDAPPAKKRALASNMPASTTLAQSHNATAIMSSVQSAAPPSVPPRTVQLAGGRTLQLSANQTVHFPGGQAVQLSSGHALQLSPLQLPSLQMQPTTHSVRLPSGQTVSLATPQVMQALKASKNQSPRVQTTPTLKTLQTNQTVIPVSTVQLAGQTVQFGNQTVQLAGQSVQLTGHTVKLPSGQSVQVAGPNVLPSNLQAFQLAGGVPTVLPSGQSVQIPGALGSQTVQLAGQTVQLAGSQTVQLPSGQTLQLPSGQTLQLASGVQLANQAKSPQVVRSQCQGDRSTQPIMAKLLTNAQGQMVSLEGMVGSGRIVSGIRPRPQVRVLSPAARLSRPVLLTSGKPLHNIILQSDGSAVRVTSTGGASTSQTIVISNIGAQTATTPTTASAPVLKLQQVNPIHQVKLAQGLKIQQASPPAAAPSPGAVRSVLMDGHQLKLVSGRHVLARILRPNHPPPH